MNTKQNPIRALTHSALCLALCLALPFLTGQIPEVGGMLCPMHFPVLLCGFLCGPWWGVAVGLTAPVLRHILFHMPPLVTAMGMSVELAVYGAVTGLLYRRLPKTRPSLYIALLAAMVLGRLAWGGTMVGLYGLSGTPFGWELFLSGAFFNAIPGILLQLILVPLLVLALRKAKVME